MAPHKPRKPAPVEYSTDEEDMILYDIEEDVESTKSIVRRLSAEYWQNEVLHQTLQDNERFRIPSPGNSFMDLYRMSPEAMMRKKEDLPKKTARLDSPAKDPTPEETKNIYSDLEQDVEQPIPENDDSPEETVDKPRPPASVMLQIIIKKNPTESK
ncbi:hypothetical protein TNCV_4771271 [Trichonephila clavipes]|nr:hypothetical protein TNCV_4771271 [Trichonephila clavipes]